MHLGWSGHKCQKKPVAFIKLFRQFWGHCDSKNMLLFAKDIKMTKGDEKCGLGGNPEVQKC